MMVESSRAAPQVVQPRPLESRQIQSMPGNIVQILRRSMRDDNMGVCQKLAVAATVCEQVRNWVSQHSDRLSLASAATVNVLGLGYANAHSAAFGAMNSLQSVASAAAFGSARNAIENAMCAAPLTLAEQFQRNHTGWLKFRRLLVALKSDREILLNLGAMVELEWAASVTLNVLGPAATSLPTAGDELCETRSDGALPPADCISLEADDRDEGWKHGPGDQIPDRFKAGNNERPPIGCNLTELGFALHPKPNDCGPVALQRYAKAEAAKLNARIWVTAVGRNLTVYFNSEWLRLQASSRIVEFRAGNAGQNSGAKRRKVARSGAKRRGHAKTDQSEGQ